RGSIAFYQKDLFKMTEGSPQTSKLKAEAARAAASLKDYQTFLESLLPSSNPEWRLGKRKFSKKLELVLDAGITADQVLKEAETEFDRVQREMYVVARQLWSRYYPTEALPPYDAT